MELFVVRVNIHGQSVCNRTDSFARLVLLGLLHHGCFVEARLQDCLYFV